MEKGFSERGWTALRVLRIAMVLGAVLGLVGCGGDRQVSAGKSGKIVTLTPSATEVVAAIGAADRLVGVDEYSTFPPLVKQLPKVGGFLTPSFEAIVRLRPDLVVADDIHTEAATALRGVGIDVLLAPMHTIPDLRKAFAIVGARLGRAAAAQAAAVALDEAIAAARARRAGQGVRVLIVIDREAGGLGNMIAAAAGSWMDELIAITGAENVLAGAAVRYPRVSPEEILRTRPDVILDVSYAADPATAMAAWRTLPDVPAVANGRVRVLKDAYLLAPSPRVGEALAAIEAALAR